MNGTSINIFDEEEGYCRMLGHYVPFKYCRTVTNMLPCYRILDCWFERLPIEEFVAAHYTAEERGKIFRQPKSKLSSIIEIIERVKKDKSS